EFRRVLFRSCIAGRVLARWPEGNAVIAIGRIVLLGGIALFLASCGNAGADRTVGIAATGIVRGFVFFDANGSGAFEASDVPFEGARVRLVTPIARDTVLRAETAADGSFRATGVPVGSYAVVLDATSVGDSVVVEGIGGTVTLLPDDSVS